MRKANSIIDKTMRKVYYKRKINLFDRLSYFMERVFCNDNRLN